MAASDGVRLTPWLAAASAVLAMSACFFELPSTLDRPADVPSTGGAGAGGGVSTSTGGRAVGSTGGASTASVGGASTSSSSAQSSGTGGATGPGGAGGQGGGAVTWWNDPWTRRVHVTLDNTNGGALTDFPLLVALTPSRVDYASTQDGGADLRFVADDGQTVLAHEIERWDESGTSYVWVKVPAIPAASSAASIWMYFGNAAAADGQNAPGVWGSSYAAVYHLADDPSAPGGKVKDSTGHLLDGVAYGLTTADRVPAKIGDGFHYNGVQSNGPAVNVAEDGGAFDVPPGEARTFEVWVARELGQGNMYVMMNEGCCEGISLWFQNEPTLHASFSPDTGCCAPNDYSFGVAPYPNDTSWRYVAVVWDRTGAGAIQLYIDAQLVGSGPIPQAGVSTATATTRLGADHGGNTGLKGTLDEARFAKSALPAAVIDAQFRSMKDQMAIYGPIEDKP